MAEKELALCDECGSLFFKGSSQMMGLCPECAHILYGYPNCDHHFQDGRCVNCYWDGSKSVYIKKQNQQEETDMPTTEWLNKYESIKDKLTCKVDLEAHFTEKVIGNMAVDVLDIGTVHFPTGQIFACDPLVELEDTLPFLQTIPAGTYPVKICVVPSEKYGDRYACVKVEVSREKPVRYELGMVGNENLDAALGDDDYFGFGVDAGMGCIADIQTQAAFKTYWAKRLEEDPDIDPYNDLFCDLLEENAQAHPKYQGDCGDWLNWTVPEYLNRLRSENARNRELTRRLRIALPKAEYYDAFVDPADCTNIRTTAKELGVPEKQFTRYLEEKKYLFRDKNRKLFPRAVKKSAGLFLVRDFYTERGKLGHYTLITPAGKRHFLERTDEILFA